MSLVDQLLEPLRGPKPTKEQADAWNISRWRWRAKEYSEILQQLKPYNIRVTAKEAHGLWENICYGDDRYEEEIIKAFLFDKLYNKDKR